MTEQIKLPAGYEIRELPAEIFGPLWAKHAPGLFDDQAQIFRASQFLTDQERTHEASLRALTGTPYQLRLGLYFENEFVGWTSGHQESAETFYMRNSAVLPEHRRKGLYNALLRTALRMITEKGFQKIYSRHTATNNAVIIPKLKVGFVITALEVSDAFGVLVHLTYHPKALRRRMLDYRVGEAKPDDEIKGCLGL